MKADEVLVGLHAARLQRVGWILLVTALLVPAADLSSYGIFWVGAAPYFGVQFLLQPNRPEGDMYSLSVAAEGFCLLAGFAANILVLSRVRRWILIVTPLLTLLPIAAYWHQWSSSEVRGVAPWELFYFYPWATGIVLICLGRIWLGGVASQANPRIAYVA